MAGLGWTKIYETDPQKIGDTTTFYGGMRGLAGAALGGVANTATSLMTTPEKMSVSERGAAVPSNIVEAFAPPKPGVNAVSVPVSPIIPVAQAITGANAPTTTPTTTPTTAPPSHTPGGFIPTMAPSHTPGEVVDVDPTRGKLGGMFGFNKEGAAAPGGDTMLLGGAGARSYQTPMYAADIAKSLGVTDPARMAKNDWSDGSVNQKLAGIDAKYAMEVEASQKYAAAQKEAHNNRSLQEHFNELLYSRNTLGMSEKAMWELAGKNFAAQQDRNKVAGPLEGERIKGEFGMKAKADDLESRRLDREARRESALEVAALKAKENRETALGVAKLKMDESRTERELAAEKELRKGKVELAMPAATMAGTDLETAIAAQEMGLEPRGVKKNTFSPNEPAGFYDKKTGKLIDAATIKGMRGKTASVPAGYTQIGTSGGKPVYQDAQGKKFIGA